MASICLSAVPLLRCPSFSKQQIQFLLIPPALELVFTTTLIFTNWRSGKAFLLLTAEAWLYFALALLDLLVHIIPAVRDNLTIFRSLDIAIAAASFLPLFLYALFLYIFTTSHLITTLPSRYHAFSKLVLLLLIPSIIALNEISSFIGISYRARPSGLGVSFNNAHDQSIWILFTSITLGLVTAYQAITFSFSFFRIAKIFIYQRKIELTSSDEAYLFRGIPYMAGGIKLGAVETVVGFAQGGFGGALTRRILRFLSRAFLCIGIVKGIDVLENFAMVRQEIVESKRVVRRSNLRNLISNPRFSTFQEMTPTATNFHQNPRAFDSQPRAERGLVGMSQLASVKNPRDRVTVHFQHDAAPSLHMRFSTLDLPSPTVIVQNVKSRPVSPPGTTRSSYYPSSIYSAEVDPQTALRTPIYARHTRAFSEYSLGADSIDSLSQFPQLPVPPLPKTADEIHNIREMPWNESYLNSSEPSSRYPSAALPESANILSSRPSQRRQEPLQPPPPAHMRYATAIPAPDSASTPRTITSGSAPTRRLTSSTIATTPDNDENPFRYDDGQQLPSSGKSLPQRYSGVDFGVVRHSRSISQPSQLAALPEQPMIEDSATLDQIKRTVGVGPRIKSIGNAPRRSTPKPAKGPGLIRGSIHIEPIMIPPRSRGMMPNVELIQEVDTPQEEY